jgi:hypothetical protein
MPNSLYATMAGVDGIPNAIKKRLAAAFAEAGQS